MTNFKELEEKFYAQLSLQNRILQEMIDIAFVNVFDFVEIHTEEDEHGQLQQKIYLKNDIKNTAGVEIRATHDGFSVSAPHRMAALKFLSRYTGLLDVKDDSVDWKNKIEQEMIKTLAIKEFLERMENDS